MSSLFRSIIGGIELRVESSDPLELVDDYRYREFLNCQPLYGPVEILPVTIRNGDEPPTDLKPIFDSGEAWNLLADSLRRRIRFQPSQYAQPLWVADFHRDVRAATVCVSNAFRSNPSAALLNPVCYPLDMNLIMYRLAVDGDMIIHAGGAIIHDRGLLCAGCSGAGKSTILNQITRACGEKAGLSEDRIVVRHVSGEPCMYGTPWLGSGGICHNRRHTLDALVFPVKSSENAVRRISRDAAMERLLPVVSVPWFDRDTLNPILDGIGILVDSVPAWEARFSLDGGIVAHLESIAKTIPGTVSRTRAE